MIYTYSISTDTLNEAVVPRKLHDEIQASSITVALEGVSTAGDDLKVDFKASLSSGEETTLDALVAAHDGIATPQYSPSDSDGSPIVRPKITNSGWHYQAHSIQFEVNKLESVYNKDDEGTDLGYGEVKVYDAEGDECTTQGSADTDGVKTVMTWKPDFDFEIISGNIRQSSKETIDSYIYVNAKIATGYPAPNDYFKIPFTQGGINLKYIGADENLKTDGRASKLITAGSNGDYFEVICNYEADLLTNENRHEMSIIFEIYKDPTS